MLWLFSFYIIKYAFAYAKLDKLNNIIKVGFYCDRIKYGGVERVISLLFWFIISMMLKKLKNWIN